MVKLHKAEFPGTAFKVMRLREPLVVGAPAVWELSLPVVQVTPRLRVAYDPGTDTMYYQSPEPLTMGTAMRIYTGITRVKRDI